MRSSLLTAALCRCLPIVVVAASCTDGSNPTEPYLTGMESAHANVGGSPIIVAHSAELVAALTPENAGRRILVRAGSYAVNQLLTVPDRATLEGEGVMLFDDAGLPSGFAAGTRTALTMTANVPGNALTLGNGATVRRLAIEDLPGRSGNAVGIVSRHAGDRVSATISETEILNPTAHGVAPHGPTGCGIAVLSLNPNMGADPPPHAGASVTARITRSLVRSPAMGIGCGLFAFNFASMASISVALSDNVIGGGIIASGGVSRPDVVHDARTVITSQRNLYRDDTADACTARRLGWNLQGGSGMPAPVLIGATERNTLSFHSQDDRLEGFTTGVLAIGGRRFFAEPTAGPSSDNSVDLQMIGTTISTSACGGAAFVRDLRLAGAMAANSSMVPGNGNTLRVVFRGVTGSGTRSNLFANVLDANGAQSPELGAGNRLRFVGNPEAFSRTNEAIEPAPAVEFFTGGGS